MRIAAFKNGTVNNVTEVDQHMYHDQPVRIDTPFSPSPTYRKLLYWYFTMGVALLVLPWYVPLLVFAPMLAKVLTTLPVVAAIAFVLYWIPRYHETISYTVGSDEVSWQRGVWFRTTGIVPYRKITNVDVSQGPLSRRLGIASVKLQTAGYSASKSSAEISITGIERHEALRDMLMEYVRQTRAFSSSATGASSEPDVLSELRAIRELLESRMGGSK